MRLRKRPTLLAVQPFRQTPLMSAEELEAAELNAKVGWALVRLIDTLDLEAVAKKVIR